MLTVYTAIFGGIDTLIRPVDKALESDCRYVCYTDDAKMTSDVWDVRVIDPGADSSVVASRRFKILSHLHMEGDSIYLDGNMKIQDDLSGTLPDNDMGVFAHPERDCIYKEIDACVRFRKESAIMGAKLRTHYLALKMPACKNLFACSLISRLCTPTVCRFNERWWDDFTAISTLRDQPSFAYATWLLGLEPEIIPGYLRDNRWVVRVPHVLPHS